MSNKPRKKKHNAFKRAQRLLSNTRIWSWESTAVTDVQRIAYGETKVGMFWRQLGQKQVKSIVARPQNWVICCRALCELNGDIWVESEFRSLRSVCVNDLYDEFESMRLDVIKAQRKDHIVDVGWIIQTFDKDDRIDSNLELYECGEVTEMRRNNWHLSVETYPTRKEAA